MSSSPNFFPPSHQNHHPPPHRRVQPPYLDKYGIFTNNPTAFSSIIAATRRSGRAAEEILTEILQRVDVPL